jgi:hypothetical protein
VGGAVWRKLTSQHVQLETDLEEWSAKSALDDFEVSAARLGAMLSTDLPRVRAILFRDERDYRALAGEEWSGGKYHNENEDGVIALFLLDNWIYMRPVVHDVWQHEYTHAMVRAAVRDPPVWLNEGLAMLFESTRAEEEQRRLAIGRVMSQVPPREWPPISELIAATPREFYRDGNRDRYYAASWGVIYFLYHHHRERFDRLFAALRAGESSVAAWKSAGLDPATIQREMLAEFSNDLPREWVIDNPPWPPHVDPQSIRPLSDEEIHLMWASLCDLSRSDGRKRARTQIDEARRSAPDSAEVKAASETLDRIEQARPETSH